MLEPDVPLDEETRLATLRGLNILDTPPEERFDRLTRLAKNLIGAPIAVVSLVDSNRQWFKSCQGLDATETPRNISFCGHAILEDNLFVVPDASLDTRFADNPLVTGAPHIRFYAGQPLKANDGSRVGTLCVIDSKPHQLTQVEREGLRDLATLVEHELNILDFQAAALALQSSQNRLAGILDNVLDGIITINEQGIVESFNKSAEQIFGYVAAEVIGNNVKMLMPEPYHREHDGYLHNFITTGKRKVIGIGREVTGKRKDGSTFPMDLAVSEMKLGDKRMFTGIVRDITLRQKEERLQAQFSAIVESSTDAIMSKTLDGIVTSWNSAAENLFGYSEQEMIGQPMALLIPPDRADEEPQILAKIRRGEFIKHFETLRKKKNGDIFPVSVNISPISDGSGNIIGASKIARDITERKRSEDELANVSRLSRAVVDGAAHMIITTDTQGVILSFNRAAETSLGYRADELVGKSTPAVFHDLDEVVRRAQELTAAGVPVEPGFEVFVALPRKQSTGDTHEWTYVRKDGTRFPVMLTVSALRDSKGEIYAFLGIATDITERVKMERMKSEFISTVSHELRTPLTSIRGSLGLIAGGIAGELPAQAKSLVDIAHKNSERLILLVNDILDMEKIEAGKMEFRCTPTGLISLLKQALEDNHAYAEQHKVAYALAGDLPEMMVNVDANRLLQVLANLLSNAAKFSPAGDKVIVTATSDGNRVRVSVSDHGSGIPEQFRDQIFQKFAQADSSDTRMKGGTGLGLSITKAIIEQMGGIIGFDSQPDVLTTFFIEFPIWQEVATVASEEMATDKRKRVLICEDDHDIAALLNLMLGQMGLLTDIAYDAKQAKQLLAQHDYAAMTLDLGLPGQSGTSLIRELRAAKKNASLPVIVVSANADKGRKELLGQAFSVIDWIEKPIDHEQLTAALKQAIAQIPDTRPKVLHVEDDLDIYRVVHAIVGKIADIENAPTLAAARRMLEKKRYDLAILDVTLPDGSGMELLQDLNSATPPVPVMVFSAHEISIEAIQQVGVSLVKSRTDSTQLLATIKRMVGVA